jgi:uncharacterized protein YjbJ (UPF0337 family)
VVVSRGGRPLADVKRIAQSLKGLNRESRHLFSGGLNSRIEIFSQIQKMDALRSMEQNQTSSISSAEHCWITGRSAGMDKNRIAGSAKDFAGKVEAGVGNIADDAQSQTEGRFREATGKAQNLYGQAKDAARDARDAAASYAKSAYDNSGDTFRDGSQALSKSVQENPLGSLIVAGGIGFALALLMTRPPRRPLRRRYWE